MTDLQFTDKQANPPMAHKEGMRGQVLGEKEKVMNDGDHEYDQDDDVGTRIAPEI